MNGLLAISAASTDSSRSLLRPQGALPREHADAFGETSPCAVMSSFPNTTSAFVRRRRGPDGLMSQLLLLSFEATRDPILFPLFLLRASIAGESGSTASVEAFCRLPSASRGALPTSLPGRLVPSAASTVLVHLLLLLRRHTTSLLTARRPPCQRPPASHDSASESMSPPPSWAYQLQLHSFTYLKLPYDNATSPFWKYPVQL